MAQIFRDVHFVGTGTDVDQRAIDVEQQGDRFQVESGVFFWSLIDQINLRHVTIRNRFLKYQRANLSTRQDFDISVNTGNDFEIALVDSSFVAGDRAIFAFGQNDVRKRTDRL